VHELIVSDLNFVLTTSGMFINGKNESFAAWLEVVVRIVGLISDEFDFGLGKSRFNFGLGKSRFNFGLSNSSR
jgi:hypothetical protein